MPFNLKVVAWLVTIFLSWEQTIFNTPGFSSFPLRLSSFLLRFSSFLLRFSYENFVFIKIIWKYRPKKYRKKRNKYAHFTSDLSGFIGKVTCFEVCSRGFISPRNHQSLKALHTFIKKGVKLKQFKENISALSIYSSYHIYFVEMIQHSSYHHISSHLSVTTVYKTHCYLILSYTALDKSCTESILFIVLALYLDGCGTSSLLL